MIALITYCTVRAREEFLSPCAQVVNAIQSRRAPRRASRPLWVPLAWLPVLGVVLVHACGEAADLVGGFGASGGG